MRNLYVVSLKPMYAFACMLLLLGVGKVSAQKATVAIPVAIGSPCGASGSTNDSVKYYNFSATTNVLNKRSLCKPSLAAPGFSDNLATVTFNPYDGYLYFMQIALSGSLYNTYTYKWLPTGCPTLSQAVNNTFLNQFVAGVEFDPATGLGYQINFVDTSGWAPSAIDATGTVGQYASHAIINGNPAVAYFDGTNTNLKYIRANENKGTSWAAPVTAVASASSVGQYTSLTTVNGFPAIAYYDVTAGDLKYVRATDANGTAWGTPVTVEATNNVGQYASLVVVNGNPAIAYYDVTNGDLRYIRATDANGTAWGTPVAVTTANNIGQFASMVVANGNPAIAYYDVTNSDLRYVRSSDINGAAWGTPVALETTNNIGQYASLKIVNGNPAVAYYDATNLDLRYIRASDASGTAWGTPLAVTSSNNIGQYASLEIVNGNPGIAYYDVTNGDLRFVRANDASGTAWGTPVAVEASTNNIGQFATMVIANGNPAVAYFDATNSDLRFIRAYDANGTLWFKNAKIYNMELQQVNFGTGVLNNSYPVDFGTRKIYTQNGDVVMTPSGQLLAVYDNKYFNINWKDYGTATPLVATYIDTMMVGAGNYIVGLAYSDGKIVASVSSSACGSVSYKQLNILSGALSNVTYGDGGTIFKAADMTNITSGIGAAKKLVSYTENPVGSKTYDLVYDVFIKNYGNTPVSNVQAYDTLTKINGAGNLISGSIASITAPAGITSNPLYNGNTVTSLLGVGGTLSNIPGQNTITVRINCRVANIQTGIYYYNQAFVTGSGLFGDALRDSSTNGNVPDLNSNDKPDDVGEAQPTPLIIQVTPTTAPCTSFTNVLYTQNFGTGTGLTTAIAAPVYGSGVTAGANVVTYAGSVTQPIPDESYTITNQLNSANTSRFISLTDHTGNSNGRMLVVNADAKSDTIYEASFTKTLCANQQYSLVFYAAFPGNPAFKTVCDAFGGFVYPKIRMVIKDGATGSIISSISTGNITSNSWQQYGFKFTPIISFSNIIIQLINDASGGCGNDIAIDDLQFGSCDALPTVNVGNVAAGCIGSSTTFNSTLSDPGAITGTTAYQWQVATSASGPWTDISGANASSYTIASLAAADTGKYYRLVVAAAGNLGTASCEYPSPGVLLSGKSSSLAATTANKNKNNICPGVSVQLSLTGGSLGSGASWKWYTGSPGGTLVGSGTTLNVTPAVTTTYYVRAEGDCNITGAQSVTVTISCNIDKDSDGIPDFVESNMAAAFTDANANGVINAYDPTYAGFVDYNNDYVNDNFQADGDSDNDGIPNYLDTTFPGRVDSNGDGVDDRFDQDKDGVINMLDLDSDNDGIPDVVEAYGVDTNGDGKIDNFTDTDGDGLSDNVDSRIVAADGAYNTGTGLGLINFDGDSVPNFLDTDSDNDGIPDIREVLAPDANNDGKVDGFTDVNGDGLHDSYINAGALLVTGTDGNADGRADTWPNKNLDRDLRPNAYDLDSDGDGIVDAIEAGGGITDTDLNGLADGVIGTNGWSGTVSALGTLTLRNTDASGNPDYLDIDSDNDGIPDNIEGMSTAGYQLPTNTDTDGDGLASPYDNLVGFGGSGIFVYDNDGDGTPDYRDLDTDGDGSLDICEGNDWNLDGVCNEPLVLTGLDTDGDGLDNLFDSLNSVTNLKGTSYMMGNGGSLTGDATPGTKATVQKKTPAQGDRDWRWTATVLPVQFLGFTGSLQNIQVTLNWSLITTKSISRFEIERSTDNSTYTKVGTVTDPVQLNLQQNFGFIDNIAGVNSDILYYRLKVIGQAGEIKYSNVLVVRQSQAKTAVSIMPNPASNYATIRFYSEKEAEVALRIVDNIGKTVTLQKIKAAKGNNSVQLTGLNRYSNGVYSVQVLVNGEAVTQKLVISN